MRLFVLVEISKISPVNKLITLRCAFHFDYGARVSAFHWFVSVNEDYSVDLL